MLVMFRFRNFASFKNEVVLDLRAVSYKEMKDHVIDTGRNKIVKTLSIFGKNASGKSNLISALFFFESFVINQFFEDGQEAVDRAGLMPNIRRAVYKLTDSVDPTSEYEIIFSHKGITFQYGFMLEDREGQSPIIKEEWLNVDDQMVFDRNADTIESGRKYKKEIEKLRKLREDRLYISTLDYFADGDVKLLIDHIKEYLKNSFNVYFELIMESSVKGFTSSTTFSKRFCEDEEYRNIVETFVKDIDVGITRIVVEEKEAVSEKKTPKYTIKTAHNIYDENGSIIGEELFDLRMESSGTIRYFSFIQSILTMLENGGVFIVDEFSARLHPILTKFIIDLFQNKKNTKAQLIFTTHDISLMNRDQFRRDEIALIEKNFKGESYVYTLADIKTRSDASFAKDYMNGKYGAIPVIDEDSLDGKRLEKWIWAD